METPTRESLIELLDNLSEEADWDGLHQYAKLIKVHQEFVEKEWTKND